MAHLSGPEGNTPETDRTTERGQLLLVAVLVLAAAFIILALVVNSAIFTENLATRDSVAGSEDALEHRSEVVDSVGEIIVEANEDGLGEGTDIAEEINAERAELSERRSFQQALRGGVVEVNHQDDTRGQRIAQDNATRNFTDIDSQDSWTVATNVTALRNVQFEFTDIQPGDAFKMEVQGDSDTWTVSVSDNGTIGVTTGNGQQAECNRDAPDADNNLTVDVTGATVNGERCHALSRLSNGTELWLGSGTSGSYTVWFRNADNVAGTYSMVIRPDDAALDGLQENQNPDEPYVIDAIYSVTLAYSYQTHAVAYETDVRVAPGEVPP